MVNPRVGYSLAMNSRRQRADLIPNANNPRLLQRLVRLVASGIRKQRALAISDKHLGPVVLDGAGESSEACVEVALEVQSRAMRGVS